MIQLGMVDVFQNGEGDWLSLERIVLSFRRIRRHLNESIFGHQVRGLSSIPAHMTIQPAVPSSAATPHEALGNLLSELGDHLPPQPPPREPPDDDDDEEPPQLPEISLTTVRVEEKPVGVGNTTGLVTLPGLTYLERRGGRLEVTVRFQLWHYTPAALDQALSDLQHSILSAQDALRGAGFLKVTSADTSPSTYYASFDGWGRTADYSVLFEYTYVPGGEAYSFIARIPVNIHLDRTNPRVSEAMLITGDTVRWDDLGAPEFDIPGTTPLHIQPQPGGSVLVTGYAAIAYIPLGTVVPGQVRVARLDLTQNGSPTTYAAWTDFLNAISDPTTPDRHAQFTFASLDDFLAQFVSTGEPIELIDRDDDQPPNPYQPYVLQFDQPVLLESVNHVLDLSFDQSALPFKTVVYIRAEARQV